MGYFYTRFYEHLLESFRIWKKNCVNISIEYLHSMHVIWMILVLNLVLLVVINWKLRLSFWTHACTRVSIYEIDSMYSTEEHFHDQMRTWICWWRDDCLLGPKLRMEISCEFYLTCRHTLQIWRLFQSWGLWVCILAST